MQLILNKRTKYILLLKVAQSQKIFPSSKKRAKSLSSAFLPKENIFKDSGSAHYLEDGAKVKTFLRFSWSTYAQNEK